MSDVRMCDRCNRVFSTRDDGWSSASMTRRVKDKATGEVRSLPIAVDFCAGCSGDMETVEKIAAPIEHAS